MGRMQIAEIRGKLAGVFPQLGAVENLDAFIALVGEYLPKTGEITTRHLLLGYTRAVVAYKSSMMSSELESWKEVMDHKGSFVGKAADLLKVERLRNEVLEQLDRQAERAAKMLEDLP